jgi:enoyl-CoA hydratase/carnithine racemase
MLLHCDLVYASEGARFRFPFVELGLVPEVASSLLLPRLAAYHRAAELFLLGGFFSAEEAKEIGLVNRVLPPADMLGHALGTARAIAEKPAQAVAQTKALMKGDLTPVLAHKAKEQAIFDAFFARGSR